MKTSLLCAVAALSAASLLRAEEAPGVNVPIVKVVAGGDPAQDFRQCRRLLVGPGVNQPEPYPGYRGFVGWQSPIVLQDGTLLVGFSSGCGQAVELSDGSVWAVYIHTGGHKTEDAATEALWSIRLRVRPRHDGIDLLPAPGIQATRRTCVYCEAAAEGHLCRIEWL